MTRLSSIPDDVKWRLAAAFSAKMPFIYDSLFRPELGAKFGEIEQEVWMEAAALVFDVAKTLSLPVGSAKDLAETLSTIMIILFGPEFRSETLVVAEDAAVIVVRRCPFHSGQVIAGSEGGHAFGKCMALTLTSIPRLNNRYSGRFVRTMCTGDRQCEIRISADETSATKKP